MTRTHHLAPAGARRRLLCRSQKGAALVEFALVILPFTIVLYSLSYFGMALATKQRITNAASEGARAAVGAPDFATAQSRADARISQILGAAGPSYTPTYAVGATCATCIRVTITWTNPAVSKGLGLPQVYPLKSDAEVRFK